MNATQQMDHQKLITKLEEESEGLTPVLRSTVYQEIIAKGQTIVPSLVSSIRELTVRHYLTLMAIAELDQNALQQIPVESRLKIYSDALQKGSPHNDWGLAGRYLSGASLDIVSIGMKAIPFLWPLLSNNTGIGIWGSKEATINKIYQNRVSDFAFYLILKILNKDEPYFESPGKRDVSIESLKQLLKKGNFGVK